MPFLSAAISVLRDTGREMTTKELVKEVLDRGLVSTSGKSPDATLASKLYVCVRDNPQGPVRKIAEKGLSRSRRGSVRWAWRE
jgi:hypothetical protein